MNSSTPNVRIPLQTHRAIFPVVPLRALFQQSRLSYTLLIMTVNFLFWLTMILPRSLSKILLPQTSLERHPLQILHINLGNKSEFLPSKTKCLLYERIMMSHAAPSTILAASPLPTLFNFGGVHRFPSAHQHQHCQINMVTLSQKNRGHVLL